MDLDELECILANLIYRKLIKGYVSHKPPALVLSNKGTKEAFPPLSGISLG
jgi:hypothetical protein